MAKKTRVIPPIHPGETLGEDFLKALGLSANRLGMELLVPATRINDIVRGKRAITGDTALRLARYFGTTPQFRVNLQANYELEIAQDARGAEIAGGSGHFGRLESSDLAFHCSSCVFGIPVPIGAP